MFWKPIEGGQDRFILVIANGGERHDVEATRSRKLGSGTVTFDWAGRGGVFTIVATSDDGVRISGTVKCDAFGN